MDITGARWETDTAEAVLQLRALHANGDFDACWDWHLHREHGRNHSHAYTLAARVCPRRKTAAGPWRC